MIFFKANSEDPDETPHYVASYLGLRSLTMSHLWHARLKWVNRLNHKIRRLNDLFIVLISVLIFLLQYLFCQIIGKEMSLSGFCKMSYAFDLQCVSTVRCRQFMESFFPFGSEGRKSYLIIFYHFIYSLLKSITLQLSLFGE